MHTAEEFKKGEKRARLTEAAETLSINKASTVQRWLISQRSQRFPLAISTTTFGQKNC